ncbi:hypothetical protein F5X96DRAFT_486393 [Biscogniauxia mediterranea]|nr:hypothetical protein F5X96DRAFT_486393 [Biscogniauxia mediterranea]
MGLSRPILTLVHYNMYVVVVVDLTLTTTTTTLTLLSSSRRRHRQSRSFSTFAFISPRDILYLAPCVCVKQSPRLHYQTPSSRFSYNHEGRKTKVTYLAFRPVSFSFFFSSPLSPPPAPPPISCFSSLLQLPIIKHSFSPGLFASSSTFNAESSSLIFLLFPPPSGRRTRISSGIGIAFVPVEWGVRRRGAREQRKGEKERNGEEKVTTKLLLCRQKEKEYYDWRAGPDAPASGRMMWPHYHFFFSSSPP